MRKRKGGKGKKRYSSFFLVYRRRHSSIGLLCDLRGRLLRNPSLTYHMQSCVAPDICGPWMRIYQFRSCGMSRKQNRPSTVFNVPNSKPETCSPRDLEDAICALQSKEHGAKRHPKQTARAGRYGSATCGIARSEFLAALSSQRVFREGHAPRAHVVLVNVEFAILGTIIMLSYISSNPLISAFKYDIWNCWKVKRVRILSQTCTLVMHCCFTSAHPQEAYFELRVYRTTRVVPNGRRRCSASIAWTWTTSSSVTFAPIHALFIQGNTVTFGLSLGDCLFVSRWPELRQDCRRATSSRSARLRRARHR